MNTLFIFTDLLKTLARIESQIGNLANSYTAIEQRTPIDDALIAQFQAKATELQAAAAALLTIDYDPDSGLPPEAP